MHPNADPATTADSPGCKLGKAITAVSAGSQLRPGDRMNNLHIPCVASVCGQISIWKKIQHLDKRSDGYLRCTPRARLVYTQVIAPLLARADSRFLFTFKMNLLPLCAAAVELSMQCEVSLGRREEVRDDK